MKTLILTRHAKSSWKHPFLADIDRPLNKRGKGDAPMMGRRLAGRNLKPDGLVTSPAARALATATALSEPLGYPEEKIIIEDALYEATKDRLLDVIYGLADAWGTVMIVAHNPGLTDLVNELFPYPVANVPTCGVAVLKFAIEEWTDVARSRPVEANLDYPKNQPD
ncbi:MAG: histidine phosphatase family protein [Pseudomonadota bacterium]